MNSSSSNVAPRRSARLANASLCAVASKRKIYTVEHPAMMLDARFFLADGSVFIVDLVTYTPHPNIDAVLMDNEAGKCAIITQQSRAECTEMVHLYSKLGVEAELSNTSLLIADKHYNMVVIPTMFGKSLHGLRSKRLAMRGVEQILACGLNPLGAYSDDAEAMNNLIHNLLFATTYCEEYDCIMFPTPGNMVPMRASHAEKTRQLAKRLIDIMFY